MNENRMSVRPEWMAGAWVLLAACRDAACRGGDATRNDTQQGTRAGRPGYRVGRQIVRSRSARPPRDPDRRLGGFALEVKPGRWYVWACYDGWTGEIDQHAIPTILAGRDAGPVTIFLRNAGGCEAG